MAIKTKWEWKLTHVDEHGDLQDCDFVASCELKHWLGELWVDSLRAALLGGTDDNGLAWRLDVVRWTSEDDFHTRSRCEAEINRGVIETETWGGYRVPNFVRSELEGVLQELKTGKG